MTMQETMTNVIEKGMSLSRFGDGEFKAMLRLNGNLKFQNTSPALRDELANIIQQAGNMREKSSDWISRDIARSSLDQCSGGLLL